MNNSYRLSCLLSAAVISFSLSAQSLLRPVPGLPLPEVMRNSVAAARPAQQPEAKQVPAKVVKPGSKQLRVRLNAPANLLSSWKVTSDGATKTGTVTYNSNDLPVKIAYTDGDVELFEYTMADSRIWSKQVKTLVESDGDTYVSTDTRTLDAQKRVTHREVVSEDGYRVEVYDISYDHNPEGDCVFYSVSTDEGEDAYHEYSFHRYTWFEPLKGYLSAEGDGAHRSRYEVSGDGLSYGEFTEDKTAAGWTPSVVRYNYYNHFGERLAGYQIYYNPDGSIQDWGGQKIEIQLDAPEAGWVSETSFRMRYKDNKLVWMPEWKQEKTYNLYSNAPRTPENGGLCENTYSWNDDKADWELSRVTTWEWQAGNVLKRVYKGEYGESAVVYEKYDDAGKWLYEIYYNADGSYMTRYYMTDEELRLQATCYDYFTADGGLVKRLRTYYTKNYEANLRTLNCEEYKNGVWTAVSDEIIVYFRVDCYDRYVFDGRGRLTEYNVWQGGVLTAKEVMTYADNGFEIDHYGQVGGADTAWYVYSKETITVSGTVQTYEMLTIDKSGKIRYRQREDFDTAEQITTIYWWDDASQSYIADRYIAKTIEYTTAEGVNVIINRDVYGPGAIMNRSKSESWQGADGSYMTANYRWDDVDECWSGLGERKEEYIASPRPDFDYTVPDWPLESLLCLPTDYMTTETSPYEEGLVASPSEEYGRKTYYQWDSRLRDWVLEDEYIKEAVVEGNTLTVNFSSRSGSGAPMMSKTVYTRDDDHRLVSHTYCSEANSDREYRCYTDRAYTYSDDGMLTGYSDRIGDTAYEFFYQKATGIESVSAARCGLLVSGRSLTSATGEELTVRDLTGRTLAKGASVSVNAPGVYLVTAGGKSCKVVVR